MKKYSIFILLIFCKLTVFSQSVIDVRDFGATGDGMTDDAPAIRNAIDSLGNAAPNSTLYFPPGTYNLKTVDTTSSLPTDLKFIFNLGALHNNKIIQFDKCSRLRVDDSFQIHCDSTESNLSSVFLFYEHNNIRIENITFENVRIDGNSGRTMRLCIQTNPYPWKGIWHGITFIEQAQGGGIHGIEIIKPVIENCHNAINIRGANVKIIDMKSHNNFHGVAATYSTEDPIEVIIDGFVGLHDYQSIDFSTQFNLNNVSAYATYNDQILNENSTSSNGTIRCTEKFNNQKYIARVTNAVTWGSDYGNKKVGERWELDFSNIRIYGKTSQYPSSSGTGFYWNYESCESDIIDKIDKMYISDYDGNGISFSASNTQITNLTVENNNNDFVIDKTIKIPAESDGTGCLDTNFYISPSTLENESINVNNFMDTFPQYCFNEKCENIEFSNNIYIHSANSDTNCLDSKPGLNKYGNTYIKGQKWVPTTEFEPVFEDFYECNSCLDIVNIPNPIYGNTYANIKIESSATHNVANENVRYESGQQIILKSGFLYNSNGSKKFIATHGRCELE